MTFFCCVRLLSSHTHAVLPFPSLHYLSFNCRLWSGVWIPRYWFRTAWWWWVNLHRWLLFHLHVWWRLQTHVQSHRVGSRKLRNGNVIKRIGPHDQQYIKKEVGIHHTNLLAAASVHETLFCVQKKHWCIWRNSSRQAGATLVMSSVQGENFKM